jgi:hypothetical protein
MAHAPVLPGDEDEDEALKDADGITEIVRLDPTRMDGVFAPANGAPFLLIKSIANSTGGAAMTATETETAAPEEEAVLPPGTEAAKEAAPPDAAEGETAKADADGDDADGADGDDGDGDDDSGSAEKAGPPPEAIKAARSAYDAARREHEDAEPTTKGALDATDYLNAQTAWRRWNALGKSEGLDGTREGQARWVAKHVAEAGAASEVAKEVLEAETGVYKRDIATAERRELRAQGRALPNLSYPIKTHEDADNAVDLALSGHGDVAGAKRLIRHVAGEEGWKDVVARLDSKGGDGEAASKGTEPEVATEDAAAAEKALDDFAATMAKAQAAGLIGAEAYEAMLAAVPGAAEKAKRMLPASTEPVPAHREPDGTTGVEQLEPDAGLGTDSDKTKDHVASSVDAAGTIPPANANTDRLAIGKQAPYAVKRMHDALCPVYDADDVVAAYPALKSVMDAVDGGWFTAEAAVKQAAGKARKADRLAALAKACADLRTADPAALADARAGLRKAFTDAYPDTRIRPQDRVAPGSFTRPWITAGHEAQSPAVTGSQATTPVPSSTHVPEPQQFERGYLTAGHAAPSPADHGPNNPHPPGSSGNEYYTTAEQQIAGAAMRSIHDHIAATFAGCCPMAPDRKPFPADSANGMGANNGPSRTPPMSMGGIPTVGKEALDGITDEAVKARLTEALGHLDAFTAALNGDAAKADSKADSSDGDDSGKPFGGSQAPPFGKKPKKKAKGAAKAELLAALKEASQAGAAAALAAMKDTADGSAIQAIVGEQLREIGARYDSQITALKSQVEELGSQPDPAQAPVRGQMSRPEPAAPVEKRSLIDEARQAQLAKAAAEQAEFTAYMRMQAELSNDPKVRTRAEEVLRTMPAP